MMLDARTPGGPLEQKWEQHKGHVNLVSPANKRNYTLLVVGTGLAGASAAASLAELGYQMRVYVPYGRAWYPYFMRRLAERPANLLFILRAFFGP